jgi:hypothetical protein
MAHPLVEQLRFTRSEWVIALADVTDAEASRRFEPMNCISWIIGHLAWQEQRYWLFGGQGRMILPHLNELVGYGAPSSTPPLAEMWEAWHAVTEAADPWLDEQTTETLLRHPMANGNRSPESFGTLMRRTTYHYWYHIGESQAIRQLLGHTALPVFVGDIQAGGPYRPE